MLAFALRLADSLSRQFGPSIKVRRTRTFALSKNFEVKIFIHHKWETTAKAINHIAIEFHS